MSSQPEKGIATDRNIFHTEKQGSIMEGNTEVIFVGRGTHSRSLLFAPKEIDVFGPADDLFRIKDGIGNSTLRDAVRHIRGLDDPKSIQNLLEMITPIDPTLLDTAQETHRVSQEATPTSLWDQMRALYETNPRNLSPDHLDTAAGVVDTVLHVLESDAYTRMHTRNVQGKHIGLTPVIHEEAQQASQRLATWLEHQQTVANQNQKDAFHRAVQLPKEAAASLVIAQMMISACSPMETPRPLDVQAAGNKPTATLVSPDVAPPPPVNPPLEPTLSKEKTEEAEGALRDPSGAPTKESDGNALDNLVGGPSELPKSAPASEDKPAPTDTAEPEASPTMSKYLRDYLAPIPTGGPEDAATETATPTAEASPTAAEEPLVEEGPVVLNKDPRTAKIFIDLRNKLLDYRTKHGNDLPKDNAWNIYLYHIVRLDDDPDTKDVVEGLLAKAVIINNADMKRLYGPYSETNGMELDDFKWAALRMLLTKDEDPEGKWDDPEAWTARKQNSDITLVFYTDNEASPPVNRPVFHEFEINEVNPSEGSQLIIKKWRKQQPKVQPTTVPTGEK